MSYKPLTDEELTEPGVFVVMANRFGKTTAARIIEQARRANRLAEALTFYRKLFGEIPMSIRFSGSQVARDEVDAALAAYRGDT